jgi:hypothetical protein
VLPFPVELLRFLDQATASGQGVAERTAAPPAPDLPPVGVEQLPTVTPEDGAPAPA